MKDDYINHSHCLPYTFIFKRLGECPFESEGVKAEAMVNPNSHCHLFSNACCLANPELLWSLRGTLPVILPTWLFVPSFMPAGKHECDSPSGCHDKCPYVNGSYPFWRLRNGVDVPFLWVISGMKFYETSSSSKSLATDPSRAYSSSYFGPGEGEARRGRGWGDSVHSIENSLDKITFAAVSLKWGPQKQNEMQKHLDLDSAQCVKFASENNSSTCCIVRVLFAWLIIVGGFVRQELLTRILS